MSELIVVPDDKALCVAVADGPQLTHVRMFPSRRERISLLESVRGRHEVRVHEGRYVTSCAALGEFGFVYAWNGEANPESLEPAGLFQRDGFSIHAVAVRGAQLYVGGTERAGRGGEKLFVGTIGTGGPIVLRPIEVPPELQRSGKAVDAIVIDGDRLIAVDNVRQPKWILVYDLTDPAQPRRLSTHDFMHPKSGEVIAWAAMGPCLAILGVHDNRAKLTLHDRASFAQLGSIGPILDDADAGWPSCVFVGDRLFVPAGSHGIGEVDLRAALRSYVPSLHGQPMRYHPAPSGQPVWFVTPAHGGLFLHTPGNGGTQSEWMPLPRQNSK